VLDAILDDTEASAGLRRCIVIAMSAQTVIRLARPSENEPIHALVQTIADETFAYLFASSRVSIGESDWSSSWLAISGEEIVGVTISEP
jgi:hypothetical protein